ncbi:putative DNA-binding protein [Streptococcus suis]|nr:putative DNA-binding protein [Streptococcus suis]
MLPQNNSPLLLNRQQVAELLGIDPKSFGKYIRSPRLSMLYGGKTRALFEVKTG